MKTTIKQIEQNAKSLGLGIDRVSGYINIYQRGTKTMWGSDWRGTTLYTASSTQEAYAWLQGFRMCHAQLTNSNVTVEHLSKLLQSA